MNGGFDDKTPGGSDWGLNDPLSNISNESEVSAISNIGVIPGMGDLDPFASSATVGGDAASAIEQGAGLSDILGGASRGGIVAARGTGDGLVLRLDGRVGPESLRAALVDFMTSRKAFLSGQEVALEWAGMMPEQVLIDEITQRLSKDFGVSVKASRILERPRLAKNVTMEVQSSTPSRQSSSASVGSSSSGFRRTAFSGADDSVLTDRPPSSLFDGVHSMSNENTFNDSLSSDQAGFPQKSVSASTAKRSVTRDPLLWDDPDARIIYATLRSGQKIESEHSVIIVGDVNSGAEVIAGGDIIVLGTLRGVAHAGAYDETGGGRVIFALNLQPTQLRIGMVISRGSPENGVRNQPEIARVDNTLIVVEPYSSKGTSWKRQGLGA